MEIMAQCRRIIRCGRRTNCLAMDPLSTFVLRVLIPCLLLSCMCIYQPKSPSLVCNGFAHPINSNFIPSRILRARLRRGAATSSWRSKSHDYSGLPAIRRPQDLRLWAPQSAKVYSHHQVPTFRRARTTLSATRTSANAFITGLLPTTARRSSSTVSLRMSIKPFMVSTKRKSIFRKLFPATFGRIWKALLYFWKFLITKPKKARKSQPILTHSKKTQVSSPLEEDEATFITKLDNLAITEEDGNMKEINKIPETDSLVGSTIEEVAPTEISTIVMKEAAPAEEPVITRDELPFFCYEIGSNAAAEHISTAEAVAQKDAEVVTPVMEQKPVEVAASIVPEIRKEAVHEMSSAQAETPTLVLADKSLEIEVGSPENINEMGDTAATPKKGVINNAQKLQVATTPDLPSFTVPHGDRWAIASPDTDLSGSWKIIVSDEFKKEYDEYLRRLGQPLLVRTIAVSIIGLTAEETKQLDHGRKLFIRGINSRGIWERTLVASGSEDRNGDFQPEWVPVVTADAETVETESWWEENGTVHKSWLRGGRKYGGGDFESTRYLEQNGDVLVCESVFHPREQDREKAFVTWKFLREGA